MSGNNIQRAELLDRVFTIMEEIILNRLCEQEGETRQKIEEDINLRLRYAEDNLEKAAVQEAHKKLCDLSFEELIEIKELLINNLENEESEEDEDISELFKNFIACKEDDSFSYRDIDGQEKTYVLKARTCLKDGYYALLFPLHKLPNREIPYSKYQKFVFGDGDIPDHFELVTDEKILAKLNRMFDDF